MVRRGVTRLTVVAGGRLLALVILLSAWFPHIVLAQGSLTNGANHAGSIAVAGEVDSWTFAATAGDAIALSIGEVAPVGSFMPWIRLRDPNGVQVGTHFGALAGQINVTALASGTYTVLVADGSFSGDSTGGYLLTLAHTPGAFVVPAGDEGGAMTNGANHSGVIHLGDLDSWTFTAAAGDAIALSIGEVAPVSSFMPWIRLRDPNGVQVGTNFGALAGQINLTAPASGTYTVLVADGSFSGDSTGGYLLTLAHTPGAFVVPAGDEGGAMTNGANHSGVIHLGDLDSWTFTATAGDAIALSIGEVAPVTSFMPWIRLRDPNGGQVGTHSGALAGQINVTALASGTYTVLVADGSFSGDSTGSYLLTLAHTPGAFVVPAGDEGGVMTNGANHSGVIHLGDLDSWTFAAVAGHPISLSISEVAPLGSFAPWIRLRGPNGAQLGSASGAASAQINLNAPVTGAYTVLVTDGSGFHDSTGSYLLTVSGAAVMFGDDPVMSAALIKASHITELRTRINAQRIRFGLPAFVWTDSTLTGVVIKAVHVAELRTALQAAYAAAMRSPPSYTDPTLTPQQTVVKAVHIAELRAAVLNLE